MPRKEICEHCSRFHKTVENDVWGCFNQHYWEKEKTSRIVMTEDVEIPEDCGLDLEHQMVKWVKDAES